MTQGTVKWFSGLKGYGFVRSSDGQDFFLHYTQISPECTETLAPGMQVEFETATSPKGAVCKNLRTLGHGTSAGGAWHRERI